MCKCLPTYYLIYINYNYLIIIVILLLLFANTLPKYYYDNSHSTIIKLSLLLLLLLIIVLLIDVYRVFVCSACSRVLCRYIIYVYYTIYAIFILCAAAIVSEFFTSYSAILSISSSCFASIHLRNPVIMSYNYFATLKQNTGSNNIYYNMIILLYCLQ